MKGTKQDFRGMDDLLLFRYYPTAKCLTGSQKAFTPELASIDPVSAPLVVTRLGMIKKGIQSGDPIGNTKISLLS